MIARVVVAWATTLMFWMQSAISGHLINRAFQQPTVLNIVCAALGVVIPLATIGPIVAGRMVLVQLNDRRKK